MAALQQLTAVATVAATVEGMAIHPGASLPGGENRHHKIVSFIAKQWTSPPAALLETLSPGPYTWFFQYLHAFLFSSVFTAYSNFSSSFGTGDASIS